MKNVNLASYGVEELNEVQMSETNGGIFPIALGVAAAIWGVQAGICIGLIGAYVTLDASGKLNNKPDAGKS